MNKIKEVGIEIAPLFVATFITSYLSVLNNFTGELIITIVYLLIIGFLFAVRYNKQEFYVFLVGLVAGIIIEGWGKVINLFSWQSFNSLFSLPLWLPIAWGYAFVIMRRVGNVMMQKD
tara:strand:- start:67 stop:420 length:354 start_codon:yes stop_codon:yes gene_type:complete